MIFRFYNKGHSFVFQAYSVEKASDFLLKLFPGFSESSEDGSDWIGNYFSILSTNNDESCGYKPLCTVKD